MRFLVIVLVIAVIGAFRVQRSNRPSFAVKATSAERTSVARTAAAFASVLLSIGAPNVVLAANYGGFGSTYAEVIDPKDAQLAEGGVTDEAKQGLTAIRSYISTIQSAKADLAKDSNVELYARLQKSLDPSVVRTSLNKFNTAFSEDTQRGTDRLIRLVVQDLTELDRETQVKPGKDRAPTKTAIIFKRLTATEDALTSLSAFLK